MILLPASGSFSSYWYNLICRVWLIFPENLPFSEQKVAVWMWGREEVGGGTWRKQKDVFICACVCVLVLELASKFICACALIFVCACVST